MNNVLAGNVLVPYATMARVDDYHADGSLAGFLQGNGITFHRLIDGAERVKEICYNDFPSNAEFLNPCGSGTPAAANWDSGFYQYDGVGNIKAIGNDSFTHDNLNRLKSATINRHPHLNGLALQPAGFVNMLYNYDVYGNIRKRYQANTAGSPPYLAGSDPAERFGATADRDYTNGPGMIAPDNKIHDPGFRYDGNGNLVSDGKKDFSYDELNQQTAVREIATVMQGLQNTCAPGFGLSNVGYKQQCYEKGPQIEGNIYGPDGMRAVRQVYRATSGATVNKQTVFVRLGGNVVKEYTEEFPDTMSALPKISKEKAYIYGPLGLLATEELCKFNCDSTDVEDLPTTRYYEYDHLGTVRAITTATGALESTFDYEPFGLELKGTTVSFTDTSSNTHRFTGHERDEEAGEDYMKARMYVLSTARFPQIDPAFDGAGNPQNWNAYIYVGNSPVGASDPTGMAAIHERGDSGGSSACGFGGSGEAGYSEEELTSLALTSLSNSLGGLGLTTANAALTIQLYNLTRVLPARQEGVTTKITVGTYYIEKGKAGKESYDKAKSNITKQQDHANKLFAKIGIQFNFEERGPATFDTTGFNPQNINSSLDKMSVLYVANWDGINFQSNGIWAPAGNAGANGLVTTLTGHTTNLTLMLYSTKPLSDRQKIALAHELTHGLATGTSMAAIGSSFRGLFNSIIGTQKENTVIKFINDLDSPKVKNKWESTIRNSANIISR